MLYYLFIYLFIYLHNIDTTTRILDKKNNNNRWMYHMGNALCSVDCSAIDIRIKPCLIDFVRTKMMKYSIEHGWKFNEKDFDFVKRDPEMIRLYEAEIATYDYNVIESLIYEELIDFLEFCKVEVPPRLFMKPSKCDVLCGGTGYFAAIMRELIELAQEALKIKLESELEAVQSVTEDGSFLTLFLKLRGITIPTTETGELSLEEMKVAAQTYITSLLQTFPKSEVITPSDSSVGGGKNTKISSVHPDSSEQK
jgi:hypothetical protein